MRTCRTHGTTSGRRFWLAGLLAVTCVMAASAATTISIDSVQQRWPWNNKVDITYTVVDGQDVSAAKYRKIVFTVNVDGTIYTIDGVTNFCASAASGTHTVTWTAPDGVRSTNCTMSAAVYAADVPSGDDYMIVDLDTGVVTYEGLYGTQGESNARYNTDAYKERLLVLRKVPKGGTYPTGYSQNVTGYAFAVYNSARTWTTDRDYWFCVFPVTQAQYLKIMGSNPSKFKSASAINDTILHRPVDNVSWDALRVSGTAATSSVPVVATAGTGTFIQRLNYLTGNKLNFDLPTEVMFEIATRAGSTDAYFWGTSWDSDYCQCNNDANALMTEAVGLRKPNAWGIYNTAGAIWQWCLDESTDGTYGYACINLANIADPFVPACADGSYRMMHGSGSVGAYATTAYYYYASYRFVTGVSASNQYLGFRLAVIGEK